MVSCLLLIVAPGLKASLPLFIGSQFYHFLFSMLVLAFLERVSIFSSPDAALCGLPGMCSVRHNVVIVYFLKSVLIIYETH